VKARQFKYFRRFQDSLKPQSERKRVFDSLLQDPPNYLKHYIQLSETFNDEREIYKHYVKSVKDRIHEYAVKGRTKFATYLTLNPELTPSPFLRSMHPLAIDTIRFRVGSHCLPIETGRWSQRKREDRVCDVCGVVGDEVHFLYDCSRVVRSDLNLSRNVCEIWKQPDVFKMIGRIKSIDLL
jgi:hypothetical protein